MLLQKLENIGNINMANICENKFYISFENTEDKEVLEERFNKLFETELNGEITYIDEGIIEGYFDSKWSFPDEVFKDFFHDLENNGIYMRCLSEEYGCGYVAMNIFRDHYWEEEQNFDL